MRSDRGSIVFMFWEVRLTTGEMEWWVGVVFGGPMDGGWWDEVWRYVY